jgi:hypothetical protein
VVVPEVTREIREALHLSAWEIGFEPARRGRRMTEAERIDALIQSRLEQADEALAAAQLNLP